MLTAVRVSVGDSLHVSLIRDREPVTRRLLSKSGGDWFLHLFTLFMRRQQSVWLGCLVVFQV